MNIRKNRLKILGGESPEADWMITRSLVSIFVLFENGYNIGIRLLFRLSTSETNITFLTFRKFLDDNVRNCIISRGFHMVDFLNYYYYYYCQGNFQPTTDKNVEHCIIFVFLNYYYYYFYQGNFKSITDSSPVFFPNNSSHNFYMNLVKNIFFD